MSTIKSVVMQVEDQLLKGCTKIDMEWISYALDVPLSFVEDVLAAMEQDDQDDREYQLGYMDLQCRQQEYDAMMS